MNPIFSEECDVFVLGGGFAGMHTALLLAKGSKKVRIFSSGQGASNFWAGTLDFLKTKDSALRSEFEKLKIELPQHPYNRLKFEECMNALERFFDLFPQFKSLAQSKDSKYENQKCLSSLGIFKPCIGAWQTLFDSTKPISDYDHTLFVDFEEFTSSAMYLAAKGFANATSSKTSVVSISISELMGGDSKIFINKLAEKFDTDSAFVKGVSDLIKKQIKSKKLNDVSYILFPPVVGIKKTNETLAGLSVQLNAQCYETIALSPSIMADRLKFAYERLLSSQKITVNKIKGLVSLDKKDGKWIFTVENPKGEFLSFTAASGIFCYGSLFPSGQFADATLIHEFFGAHNIPVPNLLSNAFELQMNNSPSGLFVAGSGLYSFIGGISDDEEIKYAAGLGLAIVSSDLVVQKILKKE